MESNASMKYRPQILAFVLAAAYFVIFGVLSSPPPTPVVIPTPIDVSKIDFSKINPADIEATERHRDQLKREVDRTHERVTEVITNQGSSIADIRKATQDSIAAFALYRKDAESQITRGNEAIAAYDHVNKKNHRAQWVLCGLWIAFVGLIVTKVPLMVKQYALYGSIASIVAGCTFIFLWL